MPRVWQRPKCSCVAQLLARPPRASSRAELAAAVRGSRLRSLVFTVGEGVVRVPLAVIRAATRHPTLEQFEMRGCGHPLSVVSQTPYEEEWEEFEELFGEDGTDPLTAQLVFGDADVSLVGCALGYLVAANSPALKTLDLSYCELGAHGLRGVLQALHMNTHLTDLEISGNGIAADQAALELMPAVRANTSLRRLFCYNDVASMTRDDPFEILLEAHELVHARAGCAQGRTF